MPLPEVFYSPISNISTQGNSFNQQLYNIYYANYTITVEFIDTFDLLK